MIGRRIVLSSAAVLPFAPWLVQGAFAATARDRVLGAEDAPVGMVEYSSLTCPHCASFHAGPLKDLVEQYIDTGKVKLIYRDFPTDGLALLVAQLPHCLPDPQYFALLNQLFDTQSQWRSAQSDDQSTAMADELGLTEKLADQGFAANDVHAVSGMLRAVIEISAIAGISNQAAADCIADKELRDSIWQRAEEGRTEFNIRSTPSFILDGEVHAGSRPIDEFAKLIDPLL